MANLKEIRNRISSVKTTRQVTSAMKMVSAAKLRRAQDAITQIRPYADKLHEILSNLSESLDSNDDNPYSVNKKTGKILLVTINSNRGLCGGFNANVNKQASQIIESEYENDLKSGNLEILALGKNSFDFFRRKDYSVTEKNDIYNNLNFETVAPIVEGVMSDFVNNKYRKVVIVYNEFVNAATQNVKTEQFLPIEEKESEEQHNNIDYIFEPSKNRIVRELIPKSLKIQFYKALLDSHASEHGARMTAMHQATDNATDLLNDLNLQYNKARQTAITNEILEIVSGAEALKG
jgi:F-type H+-transporting ATPase subunit gamma